RHTADVPSIARREQRKQADRRVLGGMRGTWQVGDVDAAAYDRAAVQGPPHGARPQLPRGQVEWLLAAHLPGPDTAALERHDLVRDIHGAEVGGDVAGPPAAR